MLEAYTLEAFEQAAAVNLPPVLPEAVYRERPDLLEAEGVKGCWLPMPLHGPKRYKKYSRTFKVVVTPHKAMVVQTFGETMLADYLQDQLGLPSGANVEAEVHLYESLPGTTLPELARLEEATPGLGSSAEQSTAQLHPLTPEAAGLLLGEPGLGRPSSPRYLSDRRNIAVGQRFYHLAIPGRRPLLMAEPRGRSRLRRPSSLRVTLDFPTDQIRVHLFLSESRAQDLAGRLRKQAHPGMIVNDLNRIFKWRLPAILSGRLRGRVKIIHETLTPEQSLGGGLRRLPSGALWTLSKKLQEWLIGSEEVRNFFKLHAQRVIAASEDPRDGITLIFTVLNPPGFPQLRQTLRGKISAISGLSPQGRMPKVKVDVVPGYYHG